MHSSCCAQQLNSDLLCDDQCPVLLVLSQFCNADCLLSGTNLISESIGAALLNYPEVLNHSWRMCYSSFFNATSPILFHSRCDACSTTLTVASNSIGYVFGGYVRKPVVLVHTENSSTVAPRLQFGDCARYCRPTILGAKQTAVCTPAMIAQLGAHTAT
jgi:hypothetical protein